MRFIPARLLVLLLAAPLALTATDVVGDQQSPALAASGLASPADDDPYAAAAAAGEPVEIAGQRGIYSQVFAEPDGRTRHDLSSAPLFGRDHDGRLVPVDTTLVETSDGVRPRATAIDVVFPTGSAATGSLRMRDGDSELTLGLPGRLTAPELDGATATYREVFPGVDLKLSATADGMQQVYVVKTRAAARSRVMERLDFSLDAQNGRLIGLPGATTAFLDDKGNESLASGSAVMWDSSAIDSDDTARASGKSTRAVDDAFGQEGEQSEYTSPSEGDRVRTMGVAVTDDRLRVTPSAAMLNDPATVFPLYVDPFFTLPDQERLMVRSPHDGGPEYKEWAFTKNEGVGLCPTSYSTECTGNYRKRLFFEFGKGTSALGDGHQVLKAEFRVHQTHHASCGNYAMLVKQANPISTTTTWPGSGFVRELASPSWGGCTNPDREVSTEALRWQVQRLANGALTRLTIGLQAADETNQLAWKRFEPDAVVGVYTALKADVPLGLKVGDTFKGCGADAASAWYVNSQTPPVTATPRTIASDPDGATWLRELKVQFQVESHLEDGNVGYYLKYDGSPTFRVTHSVFTPRCGRRCRA